MTKPLTVRDRDGNIVERADGVMLDGDKLHAVRVPLMFTDAAAPVSAATLASAAVILGDAYDEAALAKLSDTAVRHTVVRRKLGAAAEGRPAPYLDAAWNTLSGKSVVSPPPAEQPAMPALTDAQKAHAAAMCDKAVESLRKPAVQESVRDAAEGAKMARKRLLSDAWKSDRQKAEEALLDGCSYAERLAIQSGAPPSYVKSRDRKLTDAEFFDKQRAYLTQQGRAA